MRKGFTRIALAALILGAVSPAAAQAQQEVTAEFLIGRWTDTGDCSNGVDFRRDGTFLTTEGAQGRWALGNGRLRFIGNKEISSRISASDSNTIVLTHDDGSTGRSTRCGTGPKITMPAMPKTPEEALRISRPIDAAYLAGRWTDNGDCSTVITFHSDGRFTVPTGEGRWTLVNERLTFTGGKGSAGSRARGVGRDRIILIQDDGSLGQSVRC